jgi:hypothetical protein
VLDSVFSNTRRNPHSQVATDGPQAGIDFEPNDKQQRLANIVLRDIRIYDNQNYGVNFALGNPHTSDAILYAHPVTIQLSRVSITGAEPAEAALNFNYQAMTTIPEGSRIDLDGVNILVGPESGRTAEIISGSLQRRAKAYTCGLGLPGGKEKKARVLCRIEAGKIR